MLGAFPFLRNGFLPAEAGSNDVGLPIPRLKPGAKELPAEAGRRQCNYGNAPSVMGAFPFLRRRFLVRIPPEQLTNS